jgi:PAS domain S-box-containing protein
MSSELPLSVAQRIAQTRCRLDGLLHALPSGDGPMREALNYAIASLDESLDGLESAAKAVARGESVLQSLVEVALDGVITIDERGIIQSFNRAAECIFGYDRAEVIGRNVSCLMPEPDASLHDSYIERYLRTGEAHIIGIGREVVGRRKGGQTFPLDLAISEISSAPGRRFVGVTRDLTERKLAEEALVRERDFNAGLVATAPCAVVVLDAEGRIVLINRFLEDLTGRKLEEVRGQSWFKTFLPAHDRERIRARFAQAMSGERTRGIRNPIVDAEGREHEIEWYDTQLPGEAGLLAIGLDVTDRLRLQNEMLQAQKLEAVGRLAGGIAHDFNNLLMAILGCCRMAQDNLPADSPAMRNLREIADAAESGTALTRQLLDFSRRRPTEAKPVELNAVVRNAEPMLRHVVGEDVRLIVETRSTGTVLADPMQIEQILMNLVINARDAMPGGGDVRLAIADEAPAAGAGAPPWVKLTISDTGVGMDVATRSKAFEPFFTTKEPGKGTGLGLSTVYVIVRELQGEISLESEPGRGTVVSILLPRSELPPVAPRRVAAPSRRPAGHETVLLVEDEGLVRRSVRALLEDLGYSVLDVGRPEDALELCRRLPQPVDLLLTDVQMPGMSGPDLASALRRQQPNLRVLYMSAYPHDHLVAQKRIRAADTSLEKPFSDEELAAKVRHALDAGEREQ